MRVGAVWMGEGAENGSHALVRRGATPLTDPTALFDVGPIAPGPSQASLF